MGGIIDKNKLFKLRWTSGGKQKSSLEEAAKKPGMLDNDGNEQTPKEVELIRRSMNILFSKLDSLTHFHFTPKGKLEFFKSLTLIL